MVTMTELSLPIVVYCMNYCCNVCKASLEKSPKLVGTQAKRVQIDESYHCCRQKYNRGRLYKGDKMRGKNQTMKVNAKILGENSERDEASGPWIFGAFDSENRVRFQLVDDRRATTLIPIICNWVESGSTITSDEWRAY